MGNPGLGDHHLVLVDYDRRMGPLMRVDPDHHIHDSALSLRHVRPQRASLIRVNVLSPLSSHATVEDTDRQTPR